jgi:hypothetical protein
MELLALVTPEHSGLWRIRLFPTSACTAVPGLDPDGEYVRKGPPDYGALDRFMLLHRASYRKRVHLNGVMEISASTDTGQQAICAWVSSLIELHCGSPPCPSI